MKELELILTGNEDAAKTLSAAMSPMGSVNMTRQQAAAVCKALGMKVYSYLESKNNSTLIEILRAITEENVPEEGSPDPKRADVVDDGNALITPAGVKITFKSNGDGTALVMFDFGRDSVFLSSSIISCVCMARRAPFIAVPVIEGNYGLKL